MGHTKALDLGTLVHHREWVQVGQTIEQVHEQFRQHEHEFSAVLDGENFVGLISRGHLGFLLGTRFGFILNSRHLIQDHLLPESLVATTSTPLLSLLDEALSRKGEAFYHDVPVVDAGGGFVGIIPVPALVRAQSELIAGQFQLAESQRYELQTKNQDLFRSLNQLRQSQGRYETLFQHSPLAVALLAPDGCIEAHNARLQNLLGACGAVEASLPNLADLIAPKDRSAFLDLLRLQESGVVVPANHPDEFTLALPGCGERLFKFHTSLVRETGQICTILHDITEQRALEVQMALQDKAALFESLVGGIAHELNNKLSPVLGFSDLLAMRLEGVPGQEGLESYCHAISTSAQEAVRIIRQLLQLSRPATMELRRTDLIAILEEAKSITRFRLKATGAKAKIHAPETRVEILADGPQIKQVFINLMINAIDALEHAVRKDLDLRVEIQDTWAVVSVEDTGHGIPADKVSRIFDPFYTTKAADRGTGLGLSVCLGIIRQHRGEISVRSTPGAGTVFRILLPLAQGEAREVEAVPPQIAAGRPSPGGLTTGAPRLEVLVIDDEEYITSLVQELLRSRLGWRVQRVHDGRQAIERLEKGDFDLVITDLRMPVLDGFAILNWLRDFRPQLLARVLVITGDTGSQDLDQELLALRVPALRKPFTPDELVSHCWNLVSARGE